MPLIVDDLLDNKLYRKKIFLPSDPKNKRKGSAIFLMTPDYASSVKTMNNPFFINNGRYESYYTEKDISFVLSENHKLLENSDEISITENSIAQYNRVTCNTTEELDDYKIGYDDDLTAFTAMVFVDHRNIVHGYAIVSDYGTRIYNIQAASYRIQKDLIEFIMLLYNPKTVRVTNDTNKRLYSKYGFKPSKYTKDNIMVREDTILTESLATAKIDIEIALWKSQIAITETIIKNFGDDNWMSHMYKGLKRKIVKIPLKQFAESTEDTLDRWEDKLNNQKATLSFYLAVKEIDAKEAFDISEVIDEYVGWVDSLSCSKTLKLKIINEVIDSYEKSIKEYEFNLKRYRTLSDAQKRVENVVAIATKVFSIFSWINVTPLGIIRGKLISAILPKSQKKAVLSEAELEAKIELYTKIIETLEEKKADIQSLDESVMTEGVISGIMGTLQKISYDVKMSTRTLTRSVKASAREGRDTAGIIKIAQQDLKNDAGNKKYIKKVLDNTFGPGELGKIFKEFNLTGYTGTNERTKEITASATTIVDNIVKLKTKGNEKYQFQRSSYTSGDMTIPLYMIDDTKGGLMCVFALGIPNNNASEAHLVTVYMSGAKIDPDHLHDIIVTPKPNTNESALLEAKSREEVLKNIKGIESYKQMRDNIYLKAVSKVTETSYIVPRIEEEAVLNHLGLQTENSITFLEGNDEVLVEADTAYNAELRKILFSERIKNHKEVMLLYDQVREDCPYIKYTFINYERYTQRNLFIDWSFYTKAFFKNNLRKYDKAVDLYFEFVNRFLDDNRLKSAGYNQKTVFIPVDDWVANKGDSYWDYKEDLNPISIIYRLAFRDIDKLKRDWGKSTFVFVGRNGYFKMNFSNFQKKDLSRFLQNVKTLVSNLPITDDTDVPDNSTAGIVNSVIDKIEANSDIKINNLTGASKASKDEIKDRIDSAEVSSDDKSAEEKLVDAIATTASTSKDDEETLQKMDNDEYIKQLVVDLRNSSPDNVSIEPTRAARMRKLNDQFARKSLNGKTIEQLLVDNNDVSLPEISLPIDTINDEWKHLKFANYNKLYNLDADIVRCINHFANTSVPVSVLDFSIEDRSTSEDWINTWTVKCEDSYGKRFTLKFDIPIVKNSRTMKLRGNDKTMDGQLMNLPILKTERDTCQMTSNYNKIFFATYGTSTGKSYVIADRLIKTIGKMESNPDIKIDLGDNTRICSKYELPTDYIDLASVVSKITYFNRRIDGRYTYFFNQDELREKYGDLIKDKDALPIGIVEASKSKPTILYAKGDVPASYEIYSILSLNDKFAEVYNTTNTSVRYTYSKASILSTDIPVAVIIGYYVGLIPMLDRAGIKYSVSDKRLKYDKNTQDIIRLSDAYILYDLNYDASMLLNGLKECDLPAYSLAEVNNRKMWIEFLDNFGGRLKADGLDMFYDLMIDPITSIACDKYELPNDFVDGLLYANMLLSDNKYNRHVDLGGNRYRSNEIIAAYTYKALCNSYTQYRRDIRAGRDAKMTMKQSAVIDLLFADNTFGDLSSLSDLLEFESINSTSFRGLSGMNSARAYGLDKRTFDESMINVLALSTGFSANTGISRQSTIDMNIDSTRGYIKKSNTDDMSVTKTFCMTEALTPFGITSDDPFRSAMTFVQTSQHGMRTKIADPLLVTNGADEALPYLTSNTFTYKTKDAGKIKEKTDEYMVLEYKSGATEIVDLREKILKNSAGGMYIAVKLDTDFKEGNMFKANEIVAYDKNSYTDNVGPSGSLAYDIGTLVKFAIIDSDEGFEDSAIQTEWISEAMSSTVIVNKEYTLPKDTNVYFIAKKGQAIQEGEPLLIFQNAFDEEDANMLIKTLSDEDEDIVAELGRIPVYSKITGVIKDIKILRTVETEELSPSLKKIVNDYEKDVKKFNKILDKYDPEKAKIADATYKLDPSGKLKNAADSVRIEFSLAYDDKFSVGDKVVCYSALKGVSKGKIQKGLEPYSAYRPEEKIHYIQSISGNMKRMVGSIPKVGGVNKVMVELARQSCDIMGIKWKYFDEY